jgi:Rieske Fe-S protein
MTRVQSVEGHEHPADGDLLVFSFGGREGQVIGPDDVDPEGSPIFAFPMDADSRHIASESRLNEVILVRLEPADLSEESASRSALGIVAYSAVCTHTGCEVSDWEEDTKRLKCPCHDSEFDPSDNGRVVGGPAPLRLAALPLRVADGVLSVAGGFSGPLGAQDP